MPIVALTATPAAMRDEHAAEAGDASRAAELRRTRRRDQDRGDGDLEHVAARLPDRRPERKRAVVVGEQVADEDTRQEPQAAEVQ